MNRLFRILILALAIFSHGCYQPPSDAVLIDEDLRQTTLDTFEDYRGEIPQCAYLGRIYVADRELEDLQSACVNRSPGITGCVYTIVSPATGDFTIIYRRDDQGAPLVVHEILHAARGCWVYPDGYHLDLERLREGWEVEECPRSGGQDARHCDVELFTTIEQEAIRRYQILQGEDI